MVKTKADKELFNEWSNLGYRIRNVSNLVQNDMELDENEILIELANARRLVQQVEKLIEKTASHLLPKVQS